MKYSKIHLGGISTSVQVGYADISIRCADFLYKEILKELPDIETLMSGEGKYMAINTFPTHAVKPFRICMKCSKKQPENGEGYFFSRLDSYWLCQACGIIKESYRKDPKKCPPHSTYLYFKFGQPCEDDPHLKILPEEAFIPGSTAQKHTIQCNFCNTKSFSGMRFKCAVCKSSNICEKCFKAQVSGSKQPAQNDVNVCPGIKQHPHLSIYFANAF